MVWGCFSYYGVGAIYWVKSIMNQHSYMEILQNIVLPFADLKMPLKGVFQQDNDPKHTSRTAKHWFLDNNNEVTEWPAQSPDLNSIKNLWADIKKQSGKPNQKITRS